MLSSVNFKIFLIALFVPLVLLVIALSIMDGISYWDEFEDVWLIWIIYLTIVFFFEWKFLGKINVKMETERSQIFSKELALKIKKIVKWFLIVSAIFLVLILVLIPIGYFYNNQRIPVDQLDLFDSEIRGNLEELGERNTSQYSVRIKNNSRWDIKDIVIRVSIQNEDDNKVMDEIEFMFAQYDYLRQGFTRRFVEESSSKIFNSIIPKWTKKSLLGAIRDKYPEYNSWKDDDLYNSFIKKYPVYKAQIAQEKMALLE